MSPAVVVEGLGFGVLIGLALGTLGAGGSILTVPILVYAMGTPVQTATGTSLAIVGLNAFMGALWQLRRGRVLARVGLGFGASGLAGALLITRVFSSLLFGVTPADPATFTVVPALISAVTALACCIPAWRAARIDPLLALRYE